MQRLIRTAIITVGALFLTCGGGNSRCTAHTTRSTTQRLFLPSLPHLAVGDMDGDGVDDWILTDGLSLFITASDYLASGKAYTRVPFDASTTAIAAVVSGQLLGRTQPRVLCAFSVASAVVSVSCGILHTARYEVQWIVRNQPLSFVVDKAGAVPSPSGSPGVNVIVGDFDGDGVEELLIYRPSAGAFAIYALSEVAPDSTYEFMLRQPLVALVDGLSNAPNMIVETQQIHVGHFFDCACPPALVPDVNSSARCTGNTRLANVTAATITVPRESIWREPYIPSSPPNLAAALNRTFALDRTASFNTYAPDDLLFIDTSSGAIQGFTSCIVNGAPTFVRTLLTQDGFVQLASESVSVANVRGLDDKDQLVLFTPSRGVLRIYVPVWSASSSFSRGGGGRLERIEVSLGDLGKLLKKTRSSTSGTTALGWMSTQKPRVLQPSTDPTYVDLDARLAADGTALTVTLANPSPTLTSYYRSDAVVWNPTRNLLHFFAATFATTIPADRLSPAVSPFTSTVSRIAIDVDVDGARARTTAAMKSPPSAWLGHRTYLFAFAQAPLDLRADPDGDSILTLYELGGLDVNRTGVSEEPLHSYGCSPFRRDVLVEVDYMEDGEKSMRPFYGFDHPAIEDLRAHGIVLHVFVDTAIPRVANLGPTDFSYPGYIFPLKAQYFTPTRRGLFHYCLFLDRFGTSTVSGQSYSVPGNDFFVSLGGWTDGHGTLRHQQGTFLHELGHNLNLMHGGTDNVNWKPNFLSVMNYQFQVTGIMRDGQPAMVLSDFDCADLNESALDEFTGVQCRPGAIAAGHDFATRVGTTWYGVNASIDWNDDGVIEEAVAYSLVDSDSEVVTGGPNEYARIRFDGLNPVPQSWETRLYSGVELEDLNSHGQPRRLLTAKDTPTELTFEEYARAEANTEANRTTTTTTSKQANFASSPPTTLLTGAVWSPVAHLLSALQWI